MKSTKFWVILIGLILTGSAALSFLLFSGRTAGGTASIYQDGVLLETIDLSAVAEPYTFTVEWEGGYNLISVEPGRICVAGADCPDQVCVRQGWIANDVVPIACLPHRLIIRIDGGSDSEFDAVLGPGGGT